MEGRPVYSRGPIIFGLECASALSSLLALAALIVALLLGSSAINAAQRSRHADALATCRTITRLVNVAYPRRFAAAANKVIRETGLGDCHAYAQRIGPK